MKVKDLQQALEACDPEAEVCIEVNMDPAAHIVKQYNINEETTRVYIADNLDYVDDYLTGCFDECSVPFEESW